MEKEEKKKRGGQKGNTNSLKHGFYSKSLNQAEKIDFKDASGLEGIDEEIALIRVEIKNAITGGDERNLLLLVKAASALDKLVRTRYQISASQHKGLKEAIAGVVDDVLVPLGVNIGTNFFTKKLIG